MLHNVITHRGNYSRFGSEFGRVLNKCANNITISAYMNYYKADLEWLIVLHYQSDC